jgi:superfamily I DNA/RNA helicase
MTPEQKISDAYYSKIAIEEESSVKVVNAPRLLDLANLVLAYDAYSKLLEASGKTKGPALAKGTHLIQRFANEFAAALAAYINPLGDRPDAGSLHMALNLGRRTGSPATVARYQAEMLRIVFPWLRSHSAVLNDLFSGRAAKAAREIAALAEEESPAALLNKAALIAPVSGINIPRRWIEMAAQEAGVPVSATESTLIGAVLAKGLGEDLAKVDASIVSATPNTPEVVELQDKRAEIMGKIEDLAQQTNDRPTILAAVASAQTTDQYVTETGKKLGHTPDQEEAMLSRGRVLIAAGAGSGKCVKGDTLVQTEKGFIPIEELCSNLCPEQDVPLELYINGIQGPEKTSHIYYDGVRETFRLETALGYELEGTGPHKILVLQNGVPNWKELQQIQKGDVLCLDIRPGLFAEVPPNKNCTETSTLEIPAHILKSPKAIVTKFLRNLFDKDGEVLENLVAYTTSSPKLAKQMHTVLLAYGIPAQREYTNNNWHLYITNTGIDKFSAEIGFTLKEKQDLLLTQKTNVKTINTEKWFLDSVSDVCNSVAEVYDFVVPNTHSFSAGGFINHNTRVLASKVAYHINEVGQDPSSILATSFTTKASAELISRVEKYGAVIEGTARDGFGTTHSIAGKILNRKAANFRKSSYIGKSEGWKQTALIRLAMEQVKMGPLHIPAPQPKGIWEGKFVADPAVGIDPAYLNAVDEAIGFYTWAAKIWRDSYQAWAAKQIPFLQDMKKMDPRRLSVRQKEYLNNLFSKVKRKGESSILYRLETTPDLSKTASDPEPELEGTTEEPTTKRKQHKMDQYVYYKTPARQWFNLGRKLTRGGVGNNPEPQEEGYPSDAELAAEWADSNIWKKAAEEESESEKKNEIGIPLGEFKNAISIFKGKGLSPSEAWAGKGPHAAESDEAAVYAAYEWLKGSNGEPDFTGTGDMDDILIDTVTALVASPDLRRQLQSQYKVLLIDEAQDLNSVQHKLFGLMAGYLDPKTMQPWPDKHMTADTFAFIGDDKQAIYGFRGADPDEFIEKSDLVPDGDNFKTKLLDTNFRSGQAIVEAANKLISHNEKQVPMVCKANVDRNGTGRIVSRFSPTVADASITVAEEIQGMMEAAVAGAGKYKDFGIALRSNAEAYSYGLELLKRGIPFKSNARFFDDPATKALIGWLTIAEKGLDGSPEDMESAIRGAVRAPYSKLGQAFFTTMNDRAMGPWARWLVDGGADQVYQRSEMKDAAQHFAENLEKVAAMSGGPAEILGKILLLTGIDGQSLKDSLVQAVTEDDDLMAQLSAEAEGGKVTEDMIVDQALAPISPLVSLMEGREDLGGAMAFVRKLQQVNSKIATKDTEEEIDRDAVTIGTMHSWKGLEVPQMYVPLVGGKFPHTGRAGVAQEGPDLWSERRLAYVAITRAEQRCVLLDIPHPSLKDVYGQPIRSQFISETCVPSEGMMNPSLGVPKVGSSDWNDNAILTLAWGAPL